LALVTAVRRSPTSPCRPATACPTGTTLERANYYTKDRSRVTSFDGREYVYDGKSKQVTVIDPPPSATGPAR